MAAPQDSPEQAFRLRKFQGTNTEIDSTFLGPTLVSRSENWIPGQSYRLTKRPGTTHLQTLVGGISAVTDLLCATDAAGAHYLYAYVLRPGSSAYVHVVKDETPTAGAASWSPPDAFFANGTALGRMVRFRDRVYAGNGVDPLVTWKIGAPSADTFTFVPMAAVTLPAPGPTPVDAPTDAPVVLPTGVYQYCWAIFNSVTGRYDARSVASSFAITTGTPPTSVGQTLSVTSPAAALTADQVYRFFVAPRGFPIEYATAQSTNWPASTTRTFSSFDVTDLRCPINTGIMRTGNMFLVWRNRVVFAGQASDPYSVFSTDTLLPGLEQASYNQGTFFPVNAKVPLPDQVTGIGIAGVTTDQDSQSPLLFFTLTRTFLCMGDPFSTTQEATLVEISSRVGCVGHDSIVNTPAGTIFCGLDSVYLIPPGGGYPLDIGWPIADQIRTIPPGLRATICATFHKQFYKLAIPAAAGGQNTQQWWLDLRQGITDTPSWWGPMTGYAVSAFATALDLATEIDRGYAAIPVATAWPVPVLVRHHQPRYIDYVPAPASEMGITSVLRTGRFDADQPFIAKVFTRLRLIAQTTGKSTITVQFVTDGGTTWGTIDPIRLGDDMEEAGQFVSLPPIPDPPGPAPWQSWNTAQFGTVAPVEIQTITPAVRPRGLSAVVTLTHAPIPTDGRRFVPNVELRDFELLFLPSERKVRYLGERTGK